MVEWSVVCDTPDHMHFPEHRKPLPILSPSPIRTLSVLLILNHSLVISFFIPMHFVSFYCFFDFSFILKSAISMNLSDSVLIKIFKIILIVVGLFDMKLI